MKKVSPINRALRPVGNTAEREAPRGRAVRGQQKRSQTGRPRRGKPQLTVADTQPQSAPEPVSRDELRGLFENYHTREQAQQYLYLEQRFSDAITELKAKVSSQELQIQSLQSTLDTERTLSKSAIANLKDLFDGNYRVMTDISDKYEDSHQAFQEDKAGFDRRLDFIQQESQDNNSQLRKAIIKSQDEDRVQLAESLRALADTIDRK